MENLRMPASYATLPEEGAAGDLWPAENWEMHWTALRITSTWTISSFRGESSPSPSRLCLCSCSVVVSGYRFVENIYKNLSNWFGYHDDTFSAVSNFTDEMRQKQQQRGI